LDMLIFALSWQKFTNESPVIAGVTGPKFTKFLRDVNAHTDIAILVVVTSFNFEKRAIITQKRCKIDKVKRKTNKKSYMAYL